MPNDINTAYSTRLILLQKLCFETVKKMHLFVQDVKDGFSVHIQLENVTVTT